MHAELQCQMHRIDAVCDGLVQPLRIPGLTSHLD